MIHVTLLIRLKMYFHTHFYRMFHIHIKLNAVGRDPKATHATYKAFNDGEPQVLKKHFDGICLFTQGNS